MSSKVTCSSCGWSWNKSDSSKKDLYVCHQCGKDNTMKDGGWLNKFEDAPEAQNGIEGTMGGLTDKGFNYNGAWGGTMAMGGSLPGSVGFTYARTQSPAPSNGKYAKKTKASAQNGQEMKFYQEGLDWNPKTISRDGSNIPQAEDGWLEKLQSNLNPYNWGVKDYSKNKDFSKAYSSAKKAGEEEFMYNGKRFNTKYAGTPRQEVGTYGVKGKPVSESKKITQLNLYPIAGRYLPGHISATTDDRDDRINLDSYQNNGPNTINYGPTGNIGSTYYFKDEGEKAYNIYQSLNEEKQFTDVAKSLPRGKHYDFEKNDFVKEPSTWNLLTNNCADNVCDAFGVPRSKGLQTPSGALDKIKNKYPTLDVTGRTYDDYKNLAAKLSGSMPEKILPQSKNILGIASSPDLKDLSYSLIQSIQNALYESGYELPNSVAGYNSDYPIYDGIYGKETKKALLDWQKKNKGKTFATGGIIEDDRGQWDHPGEITKINSNEITMQGVDYPVLGVSDTGDTQMMQPGEDYTYDGKSVTEYPMMKDGGWLNKYNVPKAQPGGKYDGTLDFKALMNPGIAQSSTKVAMSKDQPKAAIQLNKYKAEQAAKQKEAARKLDLAKKGQTDLSNLAADIGTNALTIPTQFRTPTQEELEAGRSGNWSERLPMMRDAVTYGLGNELAGGAMEYAAKNAGPLLNKAGKYFTEERLANLADKLNVGTKLDTFESFKNKLFNKSKSPLNEERFNFSGEELDRIKDKYRSEFEKLYGNEFSEKDLGLYSKLKESQNIERFPTDFKYQQYKDINKDIINTHNIRTNYTPEEELLIDAYTKGYDNLLNQRPLREWDDPASIDFYNNEIIPKFEELIKTNKFKKPTELIRGTNDFTINNVWRNNVEQPVGSIKYSELLPGDEWMPESFMSTSVSHPDIHPFFGHSSLRSKIIAPENQSFLFPNATPIKNFENEMEIILPKNLRYKVAEFNEPPMRYKTAEDVPEGFKIEGIIEKKDGKFYYPNKHFPTSISPENALSKINDLHLSNKFNRYTHHIVNPYKNGGWLNKYN